jgi:hypothetical protein
MVQRAPQRNYFSSPGHPQANWQVEATNKTILKILKKKLGDRKGDWADDLPEVLWAYRTTRRTPTEETPYALAFGAEAIIPAELGSQSFRWNRTKPRPTMKDSSFTWTCYRKSATTPRSPCQLTRKGQQDTLTKK